MLCEVFFSGKRNDPGDEYQERCEVRLDGKQVANGGNDSESPEDANMGRDFAFIYDLPTVLRAAYDAGVAGDGFAIREVEDSK